MENQNNPEQRQAYDRTYYLQHRERKLAAQKRWQIRNWDKVAAYRKDWVKQHAAQESQRGKDRRAIRTALVNAAKDKPCMDCSGRFPACAMDFDHRNPSEKLFTIGEGRSRTISSIQAEIAKCDVVCANCHRIRTHRG